MNRALILLVALAWSLLAVQPGWTLSWDDVVAAARAEGKVVVIGPPSQELRQTMPTAFKARYGISLEYLGGRTSETAARMRAERRAGVYSVDAVLAGNESMALIFHKEKMLDPLRPALILPEVLDGSKWKKGKLWFTDPEDQYILRLANSVSNMFHINTKEVKLDELRSAQELLNPKWKGRIALQDPTVPGSGSNQAAHLYLQLGEEFIRKLYIEQKPMITRDTRILTDGLVRGAYPITLGAEDAEVDKLRKEGVPISLLQGFSDLYSEISAGFGQIGIISNAPHPNAAKVFANWMASKEGMEIYVRAKGVAPTRNDIDESFLPPEVIPREGVKYFDTFDWEYTTKTKEEVRLRIKNLLQAR